MLYSTCKILILALGHPCRVRNSDINTIRPRISIRFASSLYIKDIIKVNKTWKIADWGSAKADASGVGQTLNVGTTSYLPPEAESGDYNHYTDAYSFGIMLYEMLVGSLPPTQASTFGNGDWYGTEEAAPIFTYKSTNDENEAGIGAKLQELIVGLTKFNKDERWTTHRALVVLNEVVWMHEKSSMLDS